MVNLPIHIVLQSELTERTARQVCHAVLFFLVHPSGAELERRAEIANQLAYQNKTAYRNW